MPLLIHHIDAIAREKQRGVLFVVFHHPASAIKDEREIYDRKDLIWQTLPTRRQIIDWLDAQGIAWRPCGYVADLNSMESYCGQIYVDVPYDESLPAFRALTDFLELPDGSMRFSEATFLYLPLEKAMLNAAHDEPGFWDRWAQTF